MKHAVKIGAILLALFIINSCSLLEERLPEQEPILKNGQSEVTDDDNLNVKDKYIVVFNDKVVNAAASAALFAGKSGIQVGHVYENVFRGFSANVPEEALNGLKNHPLIAYIEPDLVMSANAQTISTGIRRIAATTGINGDNSMADVDVAIIDTGIDKDHPDLNVVDGVRYYLSLFTDSKYDDDNGHGSHVAGIVAARDNDIGVVGIVPGARLYAVKVLNKSGSGYLSDIIKGIDWVRAKASVIDVINMSLGGTGTSPAYHTALANCVNAGIVVVVAAGNESSDVFGKDGIYGNGDDLIPASYPEVAAISAMADSDGAPGGNGPALNYGPDDSFATFSNFSWTNFPDKNNIHVNSAGNAIDLLLPGVSILSCYKDMNYATMSGTSMASPHGAGLAAKYIIEHGEPDGAAGVYAVRQALIDAGKAQIDPDYGLTVLNDPDGKLENIGWAETSTVPVNQSPVANFTFSVSGLTVTFTDTSTDTDGSVTSRNWTFGDGSTSTEQNPVHTYSTGGTKNVLLSVTDDDGATGSKTQSVAVTDPNAKIDLTYTTTPVKNKLRVVLTWTPAVAADVYRNDTKIATGVTGTYTDMLRTKGTYTYYVQSGDSKSEPKSVTF